MHLNCQRLICKIKRERSLPITEHSQLSVEASDKPCNTDKTLRELQTVNTICPGAHSHLVEPTQASSQQLKLKSHQMMLAVAVQYQQCSKPICTDSKSCWSNSHMSHTLKCSPFSGQKSQQQAHLPHQMRVKTVPDWSRIEIVPSDIWIAL